MENRKPEMAIFDPIEGHTGGFARYTVTLSEWLVKHGPEVTVCTCDKNKNSNPELFTVKPTLRNSMLLNLLKRVK